MKTNTVNRMSVVLDLFLKKGNDLSLTRIVTETSYSKTTTHRLLTLMTTEGFLSKDPKTCRYEIGPRLFELGMLYYRKMDLAKISRPILTQLATITQSNTFLCVYDAASMDAIFLERVGWKYHVMDALVWQGGRLPMNCGAAPLALLAALPDDEVLKIIKNKGLVRITEKSLVTEKDLFKELKKIRARGYSITIEDVAVGFGSVGAPVYGPDDKVIASISVAGTIDQYQGDALKERVRLIIEASADLSMRMGSGKRQPGNNF